MLRDNCTHVASREKELLAAAVNVGGAVTAAKKQNKPGTVVPLLCNDVRRCGCALAVLWCLATHVPCRYVHCFALLLPALFPTLASTEHLTFTNSSNSRCLAARVRVARLYPRAWAFVAQVGDWSESSHPRQAELFFFSFLSFELSLKLLCDALPPTLLCRAVPNGVLCRFCVQCRATSRAVLLPTMLA
jgi:hypothetical protein